MNQLPSVRPYLMLWKLLIFISVLAVLGIGAAAYALYSNTPPRDFPTNERIEIPQGSSLAYIAAMLDDSQVIRSAFLFRTTIIFLGKQTSLQAGAYRFETPLSTHAVARALVDQSARMPAIKVTIPEGSTLREFDTIITKALPHIPEGEIALQVGGKEGVLFPDTYFFQERASSTEIVAELKKNFSDRLEPHRARIKAHTLPLHDIITLASIVEREANDAQSMRLVAGILLKRLQIGMALQVDAPFFYLLGKQSADLTSQDLALDSPFNTYKFLGLPPSPIGSPGLIAINAVLEPADSAYLYYLTDAEGTFHYAKTFDEHKANKARYLR